MKSKRDRLDEKFMRRALKLAEKGRGRVSPNPCVGAVLAQGGRVVGRGFHAVFGGPHAEVVALEQAGAKAKGATLYVTLEPCSTFGKTPPCVEAIRRSGLKRVVAATLDPNPRHRGRGLKLLRRAGIRVETGVEEPAAKKLIRGFARWIARKTPYVMVKEAMTLDGKIATRTGDSRWVSGPQARRWVHQLRREVDAILVGKKTALRDNPRLTARLASDSNGHQPRRIVLSSTSNFPRSLKLFLDENGDKTWVLGGKSISSLLKRLGKKGITTLLVEGGGETVSRFFKAKAVDKLYLVVAPKIVGGRQAVTPVEGTGIARMRSALKAKRWQMRPLGRDFLIEVDF